MSVTVSVAEAIASMCPFASRVMSWMYVLPVLFTDDAAPEMVGCAVRKPELVLL